MHGFFRTLYIKFKLVNKKFINKNLTQSLKFKMFSGFNICIISEIVLTLTLTYRATNTISNIKG
jgi:hypothetical protein